MPKAAEKGAQKKTGNGRSKPVLRQAEKLMVVGLDLFSKRDFASVTIKTIAKAARANSALIYYYFQNKEDLFRASIEHAILQALDNYARLRDKHSHPVDLINAWFENNVEMAVPIRKLVKIMLDYSSSPTRLASVDVLIKHFYREEMSILSNGVRQGIALGLFERVDPEQAAQFASVHLDGIMVASMIRADFDLQAAIGDLRELFWRHVGYCPGREQVLANG